MFNDDSTNIPSYPILDLFEQNIGFLSARKKEELALFSFMDSGGDPFNFNNHLIMNSFSKAVLNHDNVIQIGTRIIKFLEDGRVVVIGNEDYNKLTYLNSLSEEEVIDEYHNVRVLPQHNLEDFLYFNYDNEGELISFDTVVDVNFYYNKNQNNTFSLYNTSFIDNGVTNSNITYNWNFNNGYTYIGLNPPPYPMPSDSLIVTLTATDVDGNSKDREITIFPNHCAKPFDIDALCGEMDITFNTDDFDFDAPPSGCTNVYVIFFGDGAKKVYSSFGQGVTVSHTYLQEGKYRILIRAYTVCFSVCPYPFNTNSPPICDRCDFVSEAIVPGDVIDPNAEICKNGHSKEEKLAPVEINGDDWKMTGFVWVENKRFFKDRIGSSTQTARKNSFGKWKAKGGAFYATSSEGEYFEKTNLDCCYGTNLPYLIKEESSSSGTSAGPKIQFTRSLSGAKRGLFYRNNKIWSSHKVTVQGVSWEIPLLKLKL